MKKFIFYVGLLLSAASAAFGSEHGGGHEEEGIPFDKIVWQAVNLGILLAIIFWASKQSIIDSFAARKKNYVDQAEKTKGALRLAEAALAGAKEKLATLEAGEAASAQKAAIEAENLKKNLISDAETAAEKMKKDAELSIQNEVSKARRAINDTILKQALAIAEKNLTEKAGANASGQEASFVKQLEQVKA